MGIMKILLCITALAGVCALYSCNPEGGKPTPTSYIINGPQDVDPAWSPDGNSIAYAHLYDTAKKYPQGLYLIDRNGSNRKLVLAGYHFSPSWSPDGQWLVFTSGGTLQKCRIDGSNMVTFDGLTQLKYREFYFPDWAPDGKYILFDNPFPSDGGGVFRTDYDFTGSKKLFQNNVSARDPELSPSGKNIVYFDWVGAWDYSEIFVSDTLGNNRIRLTQNTQDDRYPTWSPDGEKIAWISDLRLCTMNANGSNQAVINFGHTPSWSVNNEIVFSHANSNYTKEVLYVVPPDGKNRKQITF